MNKTIISLLAAFVCSASIMAQTDYNALRINFQDTGNPIETEHLLEGVHITFTDDGELMNLTVNNATATYNLANVLGMSHFNGTPAVTLHANEDPDNTGKYYTTFYSGLEAYTLPVGVKAYTAEVDGENIRLTRIDGDVLPQGEAVLLYSDASGDMTMEVTTRSAGNIEGNQFDGVDVQTSQADYIASNKYYMLSYGQNKLGFYKMSTEKPLSANKAFLTMTAGAQASALRMVFEDEDAPTSIASPLGEEGEEVSIYNLQGVRLNKLQKGINIVNGKKVIIK